MKLKSLSMFLVLGTLASATFGEEAKKVPAIPGQSGIYCLTRSRSQFTRPRETDVLNLTADAFNVILLSSDEISVVKKTGFYLGAERYDQPVPTEYLVFKEPFSISSPGIQVSEDFARQSNAKDFHLSTGRICVTLTQLEAPKAK
jgi:hypothetical protein